MNTLKMITITAAALSASAIAAAILPGTDTTAKAMKSADRIEADAAFWRDVAAIANQPSGHAAAVQDAKDERAEAIELSEDRFESRKALIAALGTSAPYRPVLLPGEFSSTVNNSYFALVPNRTLVYEAHVGPDVEHTEVTTLPGTKDVNGFDCAIVHDVVRLNGVLVEDTLDWYAQRNDGVVWYFGEIALNYDEDGEIEDVEGSWRYGREDAQPGILMLASPQVGDVYRQEYLIGEAEDAARVVATGVTVTVPAGTFANCIVTQDWTPIEPDHVQLKYYAPGVGLVLEEDPKTGELNELIQIL